MDIDEHCKDLYEYSGDAADHVEARNTLLLEEMDIDEDCEVLYEYLGDAADNVEAPSVEDSQMHITPCMDTVKCKVRASERPDEASAASKTSRASRAIEANECLLHGKHLRSQLQQLLNLTFHFFPRKFHARIMKCVCNCEPSIPQDLDYIPAYAAHDLEFVQMSLGARSSPKLDAVLQQLLVIGARNMSLWRLHELLIRAADDDYELLKTKEEQLPYRLTLEVNIKFCDIAFFIGRGGNNICALEEKLGVQIRNISDHDAEIKQIQKMWKFLNEDGFPYRYEEVRSRYKRWPGRPLLLNLCSWDKEKLLSGREAIKEYCKKFTEKREEGRQLLIDHKLRQIERLKWMENLVPYRPLWKYKWQREEKYNRVGTETLESYDKEEEMCLYYAKQASTSKSNARHKQGKCGSTYKKQNESFVLEGSRCLNCLQTYENKPNYDGACRYHSGYLRNNGVSYWSCCGEEMASKLSLSRSDKKKMHATGCCSGLHAWRPHRNNKHPPEGARSTKKRRFRILDAPLVHYQTCFL